MSSPIDILVIVAAVALVAVRQFRPQRITIGGRGWLVLPVVLAVVALSQPGLTDAHDRSLSVLLLGAELVVGLVMGAGWAWTGRLWTAEDGSVWTKGTGATIAVWIGGIALRAGLMGIGALIGVHQGSGAVLLALAASVLVRRGMLVWRARAVHPSYGDGTAAAPWKDRV
ncbi:MULTISPECIES: DUF1453 family protein [unclassified Streptomyces]|uniref:DUF1453 family protein n=1 Tax=unclassified Streptomyces TaxID=2593676 RepID=UPI00081F1904|nr:MULTISPECIES: DUF1453 family protein [unclassified Streptomyces]MYZ34068.1 DUF1453 family protein [Streptomyces sp. SID4917]SCF63882.1 Protein of unknown function [Streptomyces sp. MnatMP-M17]